MKDCEFCIDLYYWLNILCLQIIFLCEWFEDIFLICQGISQCLLVQGQLLGVVGIMMFLLFYFVCYFWFGNVRELENVIEWVMFFVSEIFYEYGVDEYYLVCVLFELFEGQFQFRFWKELLCIKDLYVIGKIVQLCYIQEMLDSCQGSFDEVVCWFGISWIMLWWWFCLVC